MIVLILPGREVKLLGYILNNFLSPLPRKMYKGLGDTETNYICTICHFFFQCLILQIKIKKCGERKKQRNTLLIII